MRIPESEFILNKDGSIYHLNLFPEDIATTIIVVGDPERVSKVSNQFDEVILKKQKREFVTHTGFYKKKKLTVISTGIGTDNIDIVLNELDALVNIDFNTREVKEKCTSLNIIRIGTSGSLQPEIKVDDFLLSSYAVGFDGLLHFYDSEKIQNTNIQEAIKKHTSWFYKKSEPYVVICSPILASIFKHKNVHEGFTATAVGFYGPQSRKLRLEVQDPLLNEKLTSFNYQGLQITNLEMETAGIYGLALLLGHHAVSLNCILANRPNRTFSSNGEVSMDRLIKFVLDRLAFS
ncbi:nucleoside phosphorylase [Ascidiimonas sp. W6]|uniref:nucleoside phosphorylase n=1 Tax=Ascidiimonas meishanensis TaxID=3128903 RepID=UPI0030EEDA29